MDDSRAVEDRLKENPQATPSTVASPNDLKARLAKFKKTPQKGEFLAKSLCCACEGREKSGML